MNKKQGLSLQDKNSTPDLYTGESPIESAHACWEAVKKDLAYALGANVHRSWTARLRVETADAYTVVLVAPTRFISSKIESQYNDVIQRLWKKHDQVAPPRQPLISKPSETQFPKTSQDKQSAKDVPLRPVTTQPSHISQAENNMIGINEVQPIHNRFTFDNFIVGPSNELAFAVARQTANDTDVGYNPIVIYGGNGMGKTHLLYATKHAIQQMDPNRTVRLISGENFVNTFVSSVRGGNRAAIDSFKAELRGVDLLIIDDVHFIASKPGSQEELLHTLVSLIEDGRQIMLAMDRHPDMIDKASDRLKSYLSSGLMCKIGAADYELRVRMLDRLIARRRENGQSGLSIPQNVRDHIAARINATPRDLEGAFNQVVAQSQFLGTPITLESVQDALSSARYAMSQRLTVDKIQRAVAEAFNISLDDMVSKRRARIVARPRQVAMYLCKKLTKRSLPDIGRRFGGRDHTTVMHAVKRITELCDSEPAFKAQVGAVEDRLKSN